MKLTEVEFSVRLSSGMYNVTCTPGLAPRVKRVTTIDGVPVDLDRLATLEGAATGQHKSAGAVKARLESMAYAVYVKERKHYTDGPSAPLPDTEHYVD